MDESRNRTVYVIMGVLLVMLLIGTASGGKSKPAPAPPPKPLDNARAVLVSGGDGVDRTLVVPPCNGPLEGAREDELSVVLQLLANPAPRLVLVPDCVQKREEAFERIGTLPAAAFVLPVGTRSPSSPAMKLGATTQVLVPGGSRAETLIVSPCNGAAPKKDVVLSPGPGATSATAQRC